MSERTLPPIHSTREHEADLEPELDSFVFNLGELIDGFQDAEAAGGRATLIQLALDLTARSEALGFMALAEAARDVGNSCDERNPDAVRKAVEALTDVAQRIRRGHRSAAS